MIRIMTCVALASVAWLAIPAPAEAAESYDNCTGFIRSLPATISTQGTWCLDRDVTTSMTSGNAITVAKNNITIDCNHFKIGGLSAGTGTATYGVRADSQLNATIRNCNIRGFLMGVYISGGGGHLIEDNGFDGNTLRGIHVYSAGSTIRRNLVLDTGGSTWATQSPRGIAVAYGVDVLDNSVNGVAPIGEDTDAYGITAYDNRNGSINGNRVRGLAATGTGIAGGIFTSGNGGVVIRSNDLQGPGRAVSGGIGIQCFSTGSTARDNVIHGFETGINNCLSIANVDNTSS